MLFVQPGSPEARVHFHRLRSRDRPRLLALGDGVEAVAVLAVEILARGADVEMVPREHLLRGDLAPRELVGVDAGRFEDLHPPVEVEELAPLVELAARLDSRDDRL